MDKAHSVERVEFSGELLILVVDGKRYDVRIADHSRRLASATQVQKQNFEVSAAGYGIHWRDLDEDLSIDGLIGVVHECPHEESPSQ